MLVFTFTSLSDLLTMLLMVIYYFVTNFSLALILCLVYLFVICTIYSILMCLIIGVNDDD